MMFKVVSIPETKQDCASVSIETATGEMTIEYGAFRDGDVLNFALGTSDHDTGAIVNRVEQAAIEEEPTRNFITYAVNGMSNREVADLAITALGGAEKFKIVEADLRVLERGGVTAGRHRKIHTPVGVLRLSYSQSGSLEGFW